MSRVYSRPTALLDGTPEAARITVPDSSAEDYLAEENFVYERLSRFVGEISLLTESVVPRVGGFVKSLITNGRKVLVVQGEDVQLAEETPVYGFGIRPDGVEEFIGIARYTGEIGENEQLLAWLDIADKNNPVFRTPDLIGRIEDPAKVSELNQLLAIGEDATSWALD